MEASVERRARLKRLREAAELGRADNEAAEERHGDAGSLDADAQAGLKMPVPPIPTTLLASADALSAEVQFADNGGDMGMRRKQAGIHASTSGQQLRPPPINAPPPLGPPPPGLFQPAPSTLFRPAPPPPPRAFLQQQQHPLPFPPPPFPPPPFPPAMAMAMMGAAPPAQGAPPGAHQHHGNKPRQKQKRQHGHASKGKGNAGVGSLFRPSMMEDPWAALMRE